MWLTKDFLSIQNTNNWMLWLKQRYIHRLYVWQMSGILNRTHVKKKFTKFLWVARLRWQIYPDSLNGNTVKWSVDCALSTGGTFGLNGMRLLGSSYLYSVSLMDELTVSEWSIWAFVYIMIIDGMCCCWFKNGKWYMVNDV